MRIAIFGATSQIASDLIKSIIDAKSHQLYLYARRPITLPLGLSVSETKELVQTEDYASFKQSNRFDALINFVGVGDPSVLASIGADIFDVTREYDQLALNYIRLHPNCRYIFLSSGAVYGDSFDNPVDQESVTKFPINSMTSRDWYGAAKLHAELRHRVYHDLPIVDIRIFNYFSSKQNINAKFLVSEIIRSIKNMVVFKTSKQNIVRDYLHPYDFHALIEAVLQTPEMNAAIDAYSADPVDKMTLLRFMQNTHGLRYQITGDSEELFNGSHPKVNYFSLNKSAKKHGYQPIFNSLNGINEQFNLMRQSWM